MGAPPVEALVEAEPELELEPELDGVEEEEESVVVPVELESVAVESDLVRVPVIRVVLPLLVTGVTTGEERPAGIEAAGLWEVTTAGCEVTTAG